MLDICFNNTKQPAAESSQCQCYAAAHRFSIARAFNHQHSMWLPHFGGWLGTLLSLSCLVADAVVAGWLPLCCATAELKQSSIVLLSWHLIWQLLHCPYSFCLATKSLEWWCQIGVTYNKNACPPWKSKISIFYLQKRCTRARTCWSNEPESFIW